MNTEPHGRGFARRLRESTSCLWGTWVKLPTLETVEMIAAAGFDFIVIDQEHSPLSLESAYRATVVAQGLGLQVIVRVPDRSESHLQRLLDLGVDGIQIPRVRDAAEVRRVAGHMVFSPTGDRGLGTTARAGGWGARSREEYVTHGNENVLRAVQLEDLDAMEEVEEIVAIPELNGIFLGAGDLSLSSGLAPTDPKINALVDRLLRAADLRGIPAGAAVQTAEQAKKAAQRGFQYVMVSNDASMFREAASTLGAQLHAQVTDHAQGSQDQRRSK